MNPAGPGIKKHQILYVQAAAERGGVETVLLNYLKGLDARYFEAHVLFTSDGPFREEVERTGVPVALVEAGQVREVGRTWGCIQRIARYMRAHKIALVHNHGDKAHFYGGWAAQMAGIPAIHHLHSAPNLGLTRDRLVGLLGLGTPRRKTLAVSKAVADEFNRRAAFLGEVQVLHNGIDLPESVPESRAVWRARYGVGERQPLVALFARLQRWKGVHLFIEAAAQVAQRNPEVRFWVVGGSLLGLEKAYAEECRVLAHDLGLDGRLQFLGYCDRVYEAMGATDILTNTSITLDPFPTVVLEGMAFGKPVIATNCGGAREAIEDQQTGFLIPPSSTGLAERIEQLLNDPVRASRMGELAKLRQREAFSLKVMMRKVESLYRELLPNAPIEDLRKPDANTL